MKAIHLTAYGNPAQNLRMVEVSEPKAPSDGEALMRMEYAPINDGVVCYESANLLAERIILRFVFDFIGPTNYVAATTNSRFRPAWRYNHSHQHRCIFFGPPS